MDAKSGQRAAMTGGSAPDASVNLQLSPDAMRATLEIRPTFTGSIDTLAELLQQHSVTYGIDLPAIADAIKQMQRTRKAIKFIAARGTAPTNAVDGQIEFKLAVTDRNTFMSQHRGGGKRHEGGLPRDDTDRSSERRTAAGRADTGKGQRYGH